MGKIQDGILGLVIGDALGVPYEFKGRDTFVCSDMVGYGTYNQKPGTWSDDSSMTLATLASLAENNGSILPSDIMRRFYDWLFLGEYTPWGRALDVGGTTKTAIAKYDLGIEIKNAVGQK